MTREELLLQLRDILPPPEPAWWLIAPVYLTTAALLLGLFIIVWLWRRRQRVDRLAIDANLELQAIRADYRQDQNVHLFAIRVSRWLKQVAMLAFPGNQLQSVTGEPWLRFLDQSLNMGQKAGQRTGQKTNQNRDDVPDNSHFSCGCGRIFGAAVYQPSVDLDADQIFVLCKHWLNSIKPRLQQRSREQ
jgi:hypothetical protein